MESEPNPNAYHDRESDVADIDVYGVNELLQWTFFFRNWSRKPLRQENIERDAIIAAKRHKQPIEPESNTHEMSHSNETGGRSKKRKIPDGDDIGRD